MNNAEKIRSSIDELGSDASSQEICNLAGISHNPQHVTNIKSLHFIRSHLSEIIGDMETNGNDIEENDIEEMLDEWEEELTD